MKKIRVLVFPCGSECGLEIGRSLENLKEIELWGASSVDDHGKFFFKNYEGGLPYVTDQGFISLLNELILRRGIDFIYPAMDSVTAILAEKSSVLKAKVIGSSLTTVRTALSKKKTYEALRGVIRCPKIYNLDELSKVQYPIFLKPEVGYGSRGVVLAKTRDEVEIALRRDPSLLLLEYLPGEEYTVDCFTDFNGRLLFSGMRERRRIAKGISVNTINVNIDSDEAVAIAERINSILPFNGAWFFQLKRGSGRNLTLMEVAPRVAGSMGLHRCMGVNLPLLSVFNQALIKVSVNKNNYDVEFDRAYYNRVKISASFTSLYIDFDDCLLLDDKHLNPDAIKLIVQYRNSSRKVIIISRHAGNLKERLIKLGVNGLVDDVIHITNGESKAAYMADRGGVLIDDSFKERNDAIAAGYSALGPDAIEALMA